MPRLFSVTMATAHGDQTPQTSVSGDSNDIGVSATCFIMVLVKTTILGTDRLCKPHPNTKVSSNHFVN